MRRRAHRVLVRTLNVFDLLARDGLRGWMRSIRTVTPAMGSMTALLLLGGIGGLGSLAGQHLLQAQSAGAAVLHVYLRDGADSTQVSTLRTRLAADARVRSLRYVSKREALRAVENRPGLRSLVERAGGNPLPASFEVTVRSLDQVGGLADQVNGDPAVDGGYPTSYDAGTYRTLEAFLRGAGLAMAVVLGVLALATTAITVNGMRAAVVARWADVTTMRLVGASGWMIRGPFVVEGGVSGVLAGAIGAVLLLGVFALAERVGAATFTAALPGIEWVTALQCGAVMVACGGVLGSLAGLAGPRLAGGWQR
jgi:cell division transport system permease protein